MKAKKIRLNIVGTGRVASTLAILWQKSELIHVQAIWNRNQTKAVALQQRIPDSQLINNLEDLPEADIIAIGVTDDAIAHIASLLQKNHQTTAQTLLLHFSGVHSSDLLQAPIAHTQKVASFHPVFAFADIDTAINNIAGHYCAIESNKEVTTLLEFLAKAAQMQSFMLTKENKKRYHAALSMSANFLVTLNACTQNMLQSIGISAKQAKQLINQLMQQNLNQLDKFTPQQALTGPIMRGDSKTVAQHWNVLTKEEQKIYQVLAQQTMQLSQLSAEKQKEINKIIKN